MKPRIWIDKIKFNTNEELKCQKDSINIFVGANNSGKSRTLKDLEQLILTDNGSTIVVKNISLKKNGSSKEYLNFIKSISKLQSNPQSTSPTYEGYKYSIYEDYIVQNWDNPTNGLIQAGTSIALSINTVDRITSSHAPEAINNLIQPPRHPIHLLAGNDKLKDLLDKYFFEAFKEHLSINYGAGNIIPLHVGKKIELRSKENPLSTAYLTRITELPIIENQGDGMNAFVGILLGLLCTPQQIIFIDEPEAFLHPPQAQLLGRIIATEKFGKQVFIATHSQEFLLGLLEGNKQVSVTRLNRKDNLNHIVDLNEERINTLWNKPLLRYSNILSGLFYNEVWVCESEGDSMFYRHLLGNTRNDIFFTNCNGKGRFKEAIEALSATGVKVKIISDIDILMDRGTFKNTYTALGGDYTQIVPLFNEVTQFLKDKLPHPKRNILSDLLAPIIDNKDEFLGAEDSKLLGRIGNQIKITNSLKQIGFSIFEKSVVQDKFQELNDQLKKNGLFIVPEGELESFDKAISDHGPAWCEKAVLKYDSNPKSFSKASQFIKELQKF